MFPNEKEHITMYCSALSINERSLLFIASNKINQRLYEGDVRDYSKLLGLQH